jgi:hypothetical protein
VLTAGSAGGVLIGGEGNDSLTGELAQVAVDYFHLQWGAGWDFVSQFDNAQDFLRISGDEFGIGTAVDNGTEFISGAGLTTPNMAGPQFIFNGIDGKLYFDGDGTGTTFGTVLIADLDTSFLFFNDFQVI